MQTMTMEYYGYNIETNENHVVTPSNTFSNFTIGNAEQQYTTDMNDIIAVIVNNKQSCYEQPYLLNPCTLDAMINIRLEILKKDFNSSIRGLIIIPPSKNLHYGLSKLLMNSLSIIMDRLDIVIFGDYTTAECEKNLNNIHNLLLFSKDSKFTGLKFLKTIEYRHFTNAAYENFRKIRKITAKNDYVKHVYNYKTLKIFVDALLYDHAIENIVLEIKKHGDVYNKKEKALAGFMQFDVIKDNRYYFVIAHAGCWSDQECKKIILDIIKNYAINYQEDEANEFINNISVSEENISTKLIFDEELITILHENVPKILYNFYHNNMNPIEIKQDEIIENLEGYMKKLVISEMPDNSTK
jgi:hypothetical protein